MQNPVGVEESQPRVQPEVRSFAISNQMTIKGFETREAFPK